MFQRSSGFLIRLIVVELLYSYLIIIGPCLYPTYYKQEASRGQLVSEPVTNVLLAHMPFIEV